MSREVVFVLRQNGEKFVELDRVVDVRCCCWLVGGGGVRIGGGGGEIAREAGGVVGEHCAGGHDFGVDLWMGQWHFWGLRAGLGIFAYAEKFGVRQHAFFETGGEEVDVVLHQFVDGSLRTLSGELLLLLLGGSSFFATFALL